MPLSQELLDYYREKILTVEREKEAMISSLKVCDVKHSDMHKLQWRLGEREEEVFGLQQSVKNKDLHIFELSQELLQMRTTQKILTVERENEAMISCSIRHL